MKTKRKIPLKLFLFKLWREMGRKIKDFFILSLKSPAKIIKRNQVPYGVHSNKPFSASQKLIEKILHVVTCASIKVNVGQYKVKESQNHIGEKRETECDSEWKIGVVSSEFRTFSKS